MKLSMDQARHTASILPSRLPFKVLCPHVHLGQVEHGAISRQLPLYRQRKFSAFSPLSNIDANSHKLYWIS